MPAAPENMPAQPCRLRIADWDLDREALRLVRDRVFIEEQRVPVELEWDGRDSVALHVLAEARNRDPIGTGRLEPDGKIGRVAVLRSSRGKGIGTAIMRRLLAEASAAGRHEVYLHAQTAAATFYARIGFHETGHRFVEAGIPHQEMRMKLDG